MARHRRHRHAAPRKRPRDGGRLEGWRQIITTPTFALGLAVVAAAVLAFGTTQTYLRFSGSGPDTGCGPANCANPAASPKTSLSAPATSRGRTAPVRITYATLSTSPTGFTGELIITNESSSSLKTWQLAITYRASRITDMTGAQWLPSPGRASTIKPAPPADPLGARDSVRISYTATGSPHAPTDCVFNHVPCRITSPGT